MRRGQTSKKISDATGRDEYSSARYTFARFLCWPMPEIVGQAVSAIPTVSVLIPTKNGARYLAEVLDAIRKQQGDFRLQEIIAVDSGSRDETVQILKRHGVTVVQIPAQEFGHGRTRNLLASHAHGDALVFLTQDAIPANERWLHNLLAPLRHDPSIVGVYSRHTPRSDCHPMEWHRIVEYELHGKLRVASTRYD